MRCTKANMIVEVDGKTCAVLLSGVNFDTLLTWISNIMPDKKLQLVELSEKWSWQGLENDDIKKPPQ
jgi:hypothetical protein